MGAGWVHLPQHHLDILPIITFIIHIVCLLNAMFTPKTPDHEGYNMPFSAIKTLDFGQINTNALCLKNKHWLHISLNRVIMAQLIIT